MKIVFFSEHINFTEVSETLVCDYLGMVNDVENVRRFISARHTENFVPFTRAQELEWVRKKLKENACVFSMIEKTGGAFIGNIELMDVNGDSGELGIAITASMQNKGYGTEAIRAITDYGMNALGLKRIYLKAYPKSFRALHVYEKCGFCEYDSTPEDVYMEIFSDSSPKRNAIGRIETERLTIRMASRGEMERYIKAQTDHELIKAYNEMLQGYMDHPDEREWYAIWMIELKDGTHIGDLSFKGLRPDGATEIGYGISEGCRGKGYATESVGAASEWALARRGVTRVEAETAPDNAASQRVLEKCGFVPTGTVGEEGPRFVKTVSRI